MLMTGSSFGTGRRSRLFGYTKGEAIGGKFLALMVPERFREGSAKGLAAISRQTGTGAAIGEGQASSPPSARSGAEFPVELSLSMVMLQEQYATIGNHPGYYGTQTDRGGAAGWR